MVLLSTHEYAVEMATIAFVAAMVASFPILTGVFVRSETHAASVIRKLCTLIPSARSRSPSRLDRVTANSITISHPGSTMAKVLFIDISTEMLRDTAGVDLIIAMAIPDQEYNRRAVDTIAARLAKGTCFIGTAHPRSWPTTPATGPVKRVRNLDDDAEVGPPSYGSSAGFTVVTIELGG
jgi:hypothetical protein